MLPLPLALAEGAVDSDDALDFGLEALLFFGCALDFAGVVRVRLYDTITRVWHTRPRQWRESQDDVMRCDVCGVRAERRKDEG